MQFFILLLLMQTIPLVGNYSLLSKRPNNPFTHIQCAWQGSIAGLQKVYETQGTQLPQDSFGNTTVIAATSHKQNELLRIALEREGSAIHEKDWMGYTATHWACAIGNDEGLQILLEKNAPMEKKEFFEGLTPFHLACSSGQAKAAYLLLKKNANRNTTDKFGNSPLICAIRNGLGLGLIVELMTEQNCCPKALETAILYNNPIIVSMLINRNVRLNSGTKLRPSPFYLFEKNGVKKWKQIKATIELAEKNDLPDGTS